MNLKQPASTTGTVRPSPSEIVKLGSAAIKRPLSSRDTKCFRFLSVFALYPCGPGVCLVRWDWIYMAHRDYRVLEVAEVFMQFYKI